MIGSPVSDKTAEDDRRAWALPNGRFVYQTADGKFEVQPPNDNWWHTEDSLDSAVAWFEKQLSAR